MDLKTITTTIDPNTLRSRLTQLDQQIGALQVEREIVDKRFQLLLAQNYRPTTAFELQPLVDAAREVPPLRRSQGAPAGEGLWEATK
jgi:hypothetical protein